MLVAISISPSTGDETGGVSASVAEAVRVIRESGLPHHTDSMFTTIEGEWDEVMDVVKRAVLAVAETSPRVGPRAQGRPAGRPRHRTADREGRAARAAAGRPMRTELVRVHTGSREVVHDLTGECRAFVSSYGGDRSGLLHVFVPHATAGIAILETGAGSDDDLLATLADLLPADDRWRHRHGSRGHGRSHVMPALVPPYATVPVVDGAPPARHLAEHLPGRPQRRQPRPRGQAVVPRRMTGRLNP